jgi:hypothetical protein
MKNLHLLAFNLFQASVLNGQTPTTADQLKDSVQALQTKASSTATEKANQATDAARKAAFRARTWSLGSTNFFFNVSPNLSGIQVALSPAFGYNITPRFSVGPRTELRYGYQKGLNSLNGSSSFSTLTYSAAVFSRLKLFGRFFLQGEIGYQSLQTPQFKNGVLEINPATRKLLTNRDNSPTTFVGIGFNNNGTDMLLLYNLVKQDPNNFTALPFDYRIGFTNNF